jgi:hypothetical protein
MGRETRIIIAQNLCLSSIKSQTHIMSVKMMKKADK